MIVIWETQGGQPLSNIQHGFQQLLSIGHFLIKKKNYIYNYSIDLMILL